MYPTGNYERFKNDVLERYEAIDIPITFGVLIADYRQDRAKQYILKYLKVFDAESNEYIDFFIPGYQPDYSGKNNECLRVKDRRGYRYFFDEDIFEGFITEFQKTFHYAYEFNPVLVLVELNGKQFANARKIVIELDSPDSDIRRAGSLFLEIFNIAKRHVNIEDFSKFLVGTYLKGAYADAIIQAIGNDLLSEINNQQKNIRRFTIKT